MSFFRFLFGRPRAPSAPLPALDPLDPVFVANPWPQLANLRDREPVHRSASGAWVLSRYADVVAALSDPRLGNVPSPYAVVNPRNRDRYLCADVANNILPFLDAPRHTAPRKRLSRAFAEHLSAQPLNLIELARLELEPHRDHREMDALNDYATPYAVAVISEIIGIPEQDRARCRQWSESFFYLLSMIPSAAVREQLDQSLGEFRQYLSALVATRRLDPGADLISRLLHTESQEAVLSELELVDSLMLFFADGVENVDSAIASAIAVLLQHPEQLDIVLADSSLLPMAVEECLRFESPGQFIGRTAIEPLQIADVAIEAGSGVLLMLAAANRDSAFVDEPDTFSVRRPSFSALSFGKGRHSCIGAPLVRQQMQAALTVLFEQCPGMALTRPHLQWTPRLGHRWLSSLPVHW